MPQDGDEQNLRTESLPVQPEQTPVETQPTQPVATGAAPDQKNASDTSHPSEGETSGADRPRDEQGRFAPKDSSATAPDPVKDAIDRLSRKATQPEASKPESEASKPAGKQAAEPAKDAKAPAAKPTDEALKNRTSDDLDAPPNERARWRKETADRFDRVLTAARTTREELEKAAPFIEQGKGLSKILDDFELHQDIGFVPPEHFAGVLRAQAAINRALIAINQGRTPAPTDLEAFTVLASNVDRLRGQFGVSPASPSIKPLEGELPPDLKDMVEIYGLDEKRARLLAAVEAGSKPATTAPTQAQPPVQPPAQPPAQPAKPVGVDMDRLYGRKLLSELHTSGVQNPPEQMRVLLQHPQTKQEVINRFPGTNLADVPQIFDSLDAATRYEILKAANKALTMQKVPARPTPPPPATSNRGVPTTASPRRMQADANGDPVAAAIALLARE